MSGWKTKAAGYLSIIYGLAGLFVGLHDLDHAVEFVVTGLSVLGIGHKVEKAGAAYEKAKTDPVVDVVRRNQH